MKLCAIGIHKWEYYKFRLTDWEKVRYPNANHSYMLKCVDCGFHKSKHTAKPIKNKLTKDHSL